jgi:hypothetical protein
MLLEVGRQDEWLDDVGPRGLAVLNLGEDGLDDQLCGSLVVVAASVPPYPARGRAAAAAGVGFT